MPEKPKEQLDFFAQFKPKDNNIEVEKSGQEAAPTTAPAEKQSFKKAKVHNIRSSGPYLGWAGRHYGNPQDPDNEKKWRR